jgi:hypothetical protein
VFLGLVVLVPIALLLWTRRNQIPGDPNQDPLANRNLGANGGEPVHTRDNDFGAGGAL